VSARACNLRYEQRTPTRPALFFHAATGFAKQQPVTRTVNTRLRRYYGTGTCSTGRTGTLPALVGLGGYDLSRGRYPTCYWAMRVAAAGFSTRRYLYGGSISAVFSS
jgi:hypothetical protein